MADRQVAPSSAAGRGHESSPGAVPGASPTRQGKRRIRSQSSRSLTCSSEVVFFARMHVLACPNRLLGQCGDGPGEKHFFQHTASIGVAFRETLRLRGEFRLCSAVGAGAPEKQRSNFMKISFNLFSLTAIRIPPRCLLQPDMLVVTENGLLDLTQRIW